MAFDRVIAEHSDPDGGRLVTPGGALTQQGEDLVEGKRPPVATAELFLLLTRDHRRHGEYEIEDNVSISNKGNRSLRGEAIRGLGTYPREQYRLTAEVPSQNAGLLLRLGSRDRVIAKLRELRPGELPAELVTRVRRQQCLHRMEQARFPRGALSDALSMLAVELGLWDIDERYLGGSHFPMHDAQATTVTGLTSWNAKQQAILEKVYQKARLVVVDFIDAYRSGDAATRRQIEEHRIGGPILHALVRLLEAPDEEVEAATAALADATRALLRSPERSESPRGDGSRTPPRSSEGDLDRRARAPAYDDRGSLTSGLLDDMDRDGDHEDDEEEEEEEDDATLLKDYAAARHREYEHDPRREIVAFLEEMDEFVDEEPEQPRRAIRTLNGMLRAALRRAATLAAPAPKSEPHRSEPDRPRDPLGLPTTPTATTTTTTTTTADPSTVTVPARTMC